MVRKPETALRARWRQWLPRPASIRFHLRLIVLVAFLPLLVFCFSIVILVARDEQATFRQGATARTVALTTAVDTELKRSIAALEALATSAHLDSGDLTSFRAEAHRVLRSRPEWVTIHLAPPSGRMIMNLMRPLGTELYDVPDRSTFDEVVRTRRPAVGNLIEDPLAGRYVFAVRVPVERDGSIRYVLSALVTPDSISRLLFPQGLPSDWVGVVLDRSERIVARTVSPETTVGQMASETLRNALTRVSAGWFEGSTLEGWPVYTPFNRSRFSGWTVAMGIPAAAVEAPYRQSLLLLASFAIGLLTLGIVLSGVLSRKSAQPLEALARMAKDLGLGNTPPTPEAEMDFPTWVVEVDELRQAFSNASRLVQAREEERDRVEASLREVEATLRESDRRKDHFLAMLGHELRNPLGIISNAVYLLREKTGAHQDLIDLREMMERQVAHMSRLLDDLLDVSRIAEGRIQVSKKLADFVAIVLEVASDHREDLEKSGLELIVDVPDRPLWVMGDPTRLAQAVSNLLHNAQKFSNPGGTVSVRVEETDGGASTTLRVRDTGVGMEPEILATAFVPFTQAESTIARSRGGLGLGLALVKGLVELHDGAVGAASDGPGRGSELVIRLPLAPATASHDAASDIYPSDDRPQRVLIVEDNRIAARTLKMFLVRRGHEVEVSHSGREGIEAAGWFHPSVVLCDIGLPEADGYQVAKVLRNQHELHDTRLIAITGYGQNVDRARARAAGFDRHLTKPVNLDELQRILGELGADG